MRPVAAAAALLVAGRWAAGAGPVPQDWLVNGWTVTLRAADGSWAVKPPAGAAPVLEGPPTCELSSTGARSSIAIGTGSFDPPMSFGAFQLDLAGASSITWHRTCRETPTVSPVAGGVAISWPVRGLANPQAVAGLAFVGRGSRDLEVALFCTSPDGVAGEIQLVASPGEEFFGLGSQVTGMSLGGRTYPLWTQEQGIGKPEGGGYFPLNNVPEAAYAPMGIWHSSRGYTAIVADDAFAEIDLARTHPDRVALRGYPTLPGFVLVAGADVRARLARLADYVGRPPAPPVWAFAPWNDAVGGPVRLWEVASLLRRERIPSAAIWSEDWAGGDQGPFGFRLSYAWEWDPATYPDLPADVAALHARGFAFLAYFNTFVPKATRMWSEGRAAGFLVRDAAGDPYTFLDPAFRDAGLCDLTNPGAQAWLRTYLETAAITLDIDGWMADFAEWMPYDGVLHSGASCWLEHNRYPGRWHQANLDVLGPAGGTYFVRSGWASSRGGSPGLAPLYWGGDQNTDWKHDDGFPTVMPIAAHLGLCGVSVFGSDIAGYTSVVSPPTTKELFLRWAPLAAFTPLMRTHHGSNQSANWTFDRDAETLARYGQMARVHALLLPVFQTLLGEAQGQGLPMLRHPWLVEPGRPGLWQTADYEIFLGDDMLLAPVLRPWELRRTVRAPGPAWWPLFAKRPLPGGTPGPGGTWLHDLAAPLGTIPVLVRPGTILPLLAEPVDSFYGATAPGITDLDDVRGRFRVALYPDGAGALTPTGVGAASLSGNGFTTLPVPWDQARVDGQPVPPCGSPATPPCHGAGTLLVRGQTIGIQVGGAALAVSGAVDQEYRIGVGGFAWGPYSLEAPIGQP